MTQSPLLGFNNNVKHRGRLFHIQTEDSGVRHPHVITHLFMDGGRILKTVKTSYAEHIGSDKLQQLVRELMKEQHKTMFIALRDGKFDHALDSTPPPSMQAVSVPAKAVPGPAAASRASLPATGATAGKSMAAPGSAGRISTGGKSAPSVPAGRVSTAGMPAPAAVPASRVSTSGMSAPAPPAGKGPTTVAPPTVRQGTPSSAGMRAAAKAGDPAGPSTGVRPAQRREAPELFAGQPTESAVVNVVAEGQKDAEGAPAKGEAKEQPGSGRYVAPRPAAIFSAARNPEAGGSIFGDDLISEKSLDEVILSYLSDDLDSSAKK